MTTAKNVFLVEVDEPLVGSEYMFRGEEFSWWG